jgi:WD40 repeat protein
MRQIASIIWAAAFVLWPANGLAAEAAPPDFTRDIAPILAKYCAGCHNGTDREGNLSIESFADLQKGGEKGAVIVPGRADASLMIRALTGEVEPMMPPEDNPRPTEKEIDLLKAWVDAGATGPAGTVMPRPKLKTPEIAAAASVEPYLTALALSPDGKRLALGKYRRVELIDPSTKEVLATTVELSGKVNGVSFSRDGAQFVASSGVAGLYGVATICNTADAKPVSEITGHRDAIYDAELSPDGELLATCSYDRVINLWNIATGKLVRSLTGHNGAVFDLAFSSDGSVLATASADATIKIWKVKTGERLDTLGQPEGEQSAVAFSPDMKSIVAGGGDRQLRMWKLESRDKPRINPLKLSSTAHEHPISELAYSPDGSRIVTASEGREVVLWDAATLSPVHRFEEQSDAVTGVAFLPGGKRIVVACIDGSWRRFALPNISKANSIDDDSDRLASVTSAIAADAPPTESNEQEPNNSSSAANAIGARSLTNGIIAAAGDNGQRDVDLFRFHARKGQRLVLEIKAARNKSPLDSKLEVLDAAGNPVPRVVLQAVRTSYFTFRGHDSVDVDDFRVHAAQDMELNDYLYANGEVNRLWMLPRGPDSGFLVYPGVGASRFAYFGSTPITHPLNEPIYIVRPHRPDETILPNGLPVYTLYYENDDDGRRMLGSDSRVAFTVPADGDYLARISDIRGMGGEAYRYELVVRPPRPDFTVAMDAKDLTINAGSGKEFTVTAARDDEFDGEIRIDFAHIPPGLHVTQPLTIQAGQTFARGAITADADAPALTAENAKAVVWTASAKIDGNEVTKKPMKLGEIRLAGNPKILVHVLPASGSQQPKDAEAGKRPLQVTIAPGETIPLTLKVDRRGYKGEIKFGKELAGRNLPHGVYVDNIGLNGVTLLRGESERTFFVTARKWVPEQSRLFHLQAEREGNQTSWPVMLHVRKGANEPANSPEGVALAPEAN